MSIAVEPGRGVGNEIPEVKDTSLPPFERGAAIPILPDPAGMFSRRCDEVIERNKRKAEEKVVEFPSALLWRSDICGKTRPFEEIVSFSKLGISGFTIIAGQKRPMRIGLALERVDVGIVQCLGRTWTEPMLARLFQPFIEGHALGEVAVALPMRGDFYYGGRPLTEEELEKGKLYFAGEAEGRYTFPAFRMGGRGILIPGDFIIPVAPTEEGGYRIPGFDEPSEWKEKRDCVAVQFSGVGMDYAYDVIPANPDGTVTCGEGERVIIVPGIGARTQPGFLVAADGYESKQGIFLDRNHEWYGTAPAGACTTSATAKDLRLDALLLRHGAIMAGVKVGAVNLLTKEQLGAMVGENSLMPCDGIDISVRVYFEDTHRLSALPLDNMDKMKEEDRESLAHALIRSLYGTYDSESVSRYLSRLGRTIGHNIRICYKLNLGLNDGQRTDDNLGLFGGILDSENFVENINRYQIYPLMRMWLMDLSNVHKLFGISEDDFICSQSFHEFLSALFPGRDLSDRLSAFEPIGSWQEGSLMSDISISLAARLVITRLDEERRVLDDLHILELLPSPLLAHALGIEGELLKLEFLPDKVVASVRNGEGVSELSTSRATLARHLSNAYILWAMAHMSPRFDAPAGDAAGEAGICREIAL